MDLFALVPSQRVQVDRKGIHPSPSIDSQSPSGNSPDFMAGVPTSRLKPPLAVCSHGSAPSACAMRADTGEK